MNRTIRILIVTLLCCVASSFQASAQVNLVKKGKTASRIVQADNRSTTVTAANILQRFIEEISGAKMPVVTESKARRGDIVIGATSDTAITEDGFRLLTRDGYLSVTGKDNGVVYGVVSLLEDYLGMDYWGEREYTYKRQPTIVLPAIDRIDNPAFRYRQTQSYPSRTDSIYKWWYRMEEPQEVFAAGYWVHTFDRLLPSAVYGEAHPEYYSYFNGKRQPGKAGQWCLTNPEVLEIVTARIDSIFKAHPDQKLICVSQNDGNYTNCTCPECAKIDQEEGGPSGSLIYFINKLAERFPDKEIATLAYLYTMNPPKHLKPLPNVVVMLCDIDCTREVSLTENESGRYFMQALEGWSRISNNLFIWDYGINFDNYLAPFPNFHILQDNIRLFKKHKATMHFSQIAGSRGGDFAELRAYLVSKLMWNPDADVDALTKRFLNGYYGAAAPYLYKYIQMMTGALIAGGDRLWIYDSPVSHKRHMLKPELLKRYFTLFDEAEQAVKDDPVSLKRLQRARLPLQYSELEIARTEKEKDVPSLLKKLDLLEARVKEFGVPTLNERNNSPVEYCHLYRERYLPTGKKPLSAGAKVSYLIAPKGAYAELGKTALTDGLYGGSTFVESWVGWEGTDGALIVDLGEEKDVHSVSADFLHQVGQWILFPLGVTYSTSVDGENYTLWERHEMPEDRSGAVKFKAVKSVSEKPIRARYVKVEVTGTKLCPHWHYGVGHPSWFFLDEVTVE